MRRFIAIVFTVVLIAAMIITNPGMNRYINWFRKDIIPKSQGSLITAIGEGLREPIIGSSTMVRNYVLLSHYTTIIGSQQVRSIGILNGFVSNGLSAIGTSILLSFVFMVLITMIII